MPAGLYPQERFLATRITPGSFWSRWRDAARTATVPAQLEMLKSTGRYKAFDLQPQEYYKAPMAVWPVPQHLFWESDIAKFVEGVCYFLQEKNDPELRAEVDHLVNLIEKAQQPDGYLNIHFVVNEPEKRWSNLRDLHELYNAGHLIEAAVAHLALTGSRQFVDVMLRFIEYTLTVFGREPGKLRGYPGHPEIELALLRLYHATGEKSCLELADYFLTERGAEGGRYYTEEQERRGEHEQVIPEMMPKKRSYWYMQAHEPIAQQQTIEGHSVRAMYLLTAAADLGTTPLAGERKELIEAAWRLWRNMSVAKTAVTGGIGSVKQWEGFAINYSLPNALDEGGGYNETCASIGQLMLADRLQVVHGLDGALIGDVAERALYNSSVTTGMSLDGKAFTYDNQLASSDGNPGKRHTWFECACCPPNVLRTLAAVGGYFWSPDGEQGIAIHHPFDGSIEWAGLKVSLKTDYPWNGKIEIDVSGQGSVKLRVPSWAAKVENTGKDGYATLAPGEHKIDLNVKPRLIYAHPYTRDDTITVAYGPLIYCLEDIDNACEKNHFKDLTIHKSILGRLEPFQGSDGVTFLRAPAAGRQLVLPSEEQRGFTELDEDLQLADEKLDLVFVPYYYRANRQGGHGQFRVSIKRRHVE